MKISYHGHSVVQVKTDTHSILIDPFITGNSLCDLDPETVEPDVILLTHGHNDHVGDTMAIAERTGAQIVALNELAVYLGNKGFNAHGMNIGGAYTFDFGTVKYTKAFHSSSFEEEDGTVIYTGMPGGILLTIGEKTIYHLGDTSLYSDLKLIDDTNDIDLAFIPIIDNFTKGTDDSLIYLNRIKEDYFVTERYNICQLKKQNPKAFTVKLNADRGLPLQASKEITL